MRRRRFQILLAAGTLCLAAQVPSAAETDISSYTPQEYEQLFNRLGETLSADLINNLAPLMYGMYGW